MAKIKHKNKRSNDERIAQLLAMAWNTASSTRQLAIANQILELDPNNVEALIIKSDNLHDSPKSLELLLKALKILSAEDLSEWEDKLFFLSVNHRLAFAYMGQGNLDEAFKFCVTAIKFFEENSDDEEILEEYDDTLIKALYYRILIERRDWQKILSDSMREDRKTLGQSYAKLIAAWFMASEQTQKKVCANLLWDALNIAPDVPFYILGYFEEPEEDTESDAFEEFGFALMYYDTVAVSDEFFRWFSRGVILFGLLSGRFEKKEQDYLIDVLDGLGGFDEYEKMKNIIVETEDNLVLEALAAHKCLTD